MRKFLLLSALFVLLLPNISYADHSGHGCVLCCEIWGGRGYNPCKGPVGGTYAEERAAACYGYAWDDKVLAIGEVGTGGYLEDANNAMTAAANAYHASEDDLCSDHNTQGFSDVIDMTHVYYGGPGDYGLVNYRTNIINAMNVLADIIDEVDGHLNFDIGVWPVVLIWPNNCAAFHAYERQQFQYESITGHTITVYGAENISLLVTEWKLDIKSGKEEIEALAGSIYAAIEACEKCEWCDQCPCDECPDCGMCMTHCECE